jgi:hypothetical protein
VISSAVFLILTIAILPWLRGFVGDWKISWDDYAHQKARRARIFFGIYRVKRRNRRSRLLVRLRDDAPELIRYIVFPVYLTAVILLGSIPSITPYQTFGVRYASLLSHFSDVMRLVACCVWLISLLTIYQSGSQQYLEYQVSKTERLIAKLERFADQFPKPKAALEGAAQKSEAIATKAPPSSAPSNN